MSKKTNPIDTQNQTINISDVDYNTITWTASADSDYSYSYSDANWCIDQTPKDEIEKAELILAGICPACRRNDGKHEYSCPHYDYTVDGITINTQTAGAGVITVGKHTITEEKLEKLDKILDAIDDIEKFIDDIEILKNKIG